MCTFLSHLFYSFPVGFYLIINIPGYCSFWEAIGMHRFNTQDFLLNFAVAASSSMVAGSFNFSSYFLSTQR